jgi:undecaprenyl-diphosphatase
MDHMGPAASSHRARRFGARTICAAVGLALIAVPFGVLLLLVRDGWAPLRQLDLNTSTSLHRYVADHGNIVVFARVFSAIGSTVAWAAIFVVVVGFLLWRRLPQLALFVAVTVATSSAVNNLVKVAVERARPALPDPVAHAGGYSFPSGHAQAAVVGCSVLLLVFLPVLHNRWRYVAVIVAVVVIGAIGFSRIALGVHYLSDVVAGYVLGAAWTAIMIAIFNAWRTERGLPKAHVSEGLEPEHEAEIALGSGGHPSAPGPSSSPKPGSSADSP